MCLYFENVYTIYKHVLLGHFFRPLYDTWNSFSATLKNDCLTFYYIFNTFLKINQKSLNLTVLRPGTVIFEFSLKGAFERWIRF